MEQSKEELELIQLFKDSFYYKEGRLYWAAHKPRYHSEAGTKNGDGYRTVGITVATKYKRYYAHRIIFAIHHGYLPKLVDHIDQNPENNLINNLRDATYSINAINKSLRSDNIVGVIGVCNHQDKFMARIGIEGKNTYLGTFDTVEDAAVARKQAEETYWPKL